MKTLNKIRLSVLFIFLISIPLLSWNFVESSFNIPAKSAEENYQIYCSGCHGVNLEKFRNKKWIYGTTPAKIEQVIAKGIGNEEMQGFENVLSHDEIRALTEYILAVSKETEIKTSENNQPKNGIYGTDFKYRAELVVGGLEIPWGIEFLPNGDLLIAERKGVLSRFTKEKKLIPIKGLPPIRVAGQGGLMDLKLHPNYKENGWLYISFAYIDNDNKEAGNTEVIRCQLNGNELTNIETIYKGTPAVTTNYHFGSRIAFDNDGYVYISTGDRGRRDVFPQTLDNGNGKVHRLNDDGSIPKDNPFVSNKNAVKSIFTYGHRNIQGMAINPLSGEIWTHEHGPRGGDEINIERAGKNYGWPVISYGINYNGTTFTNDTAMAGMEQPVEYYVPSIAPCGMAFIDSDVYGDWKNSLLIGSLRFQYLERCVLDGDKVVKQERLLEGIGRVREVVMSPNGYIYVGVENPGRILKLIPVQD